ALSGTTVSRASLHNLDLIAERAVALGGYAEGASATVAQRTTLPPAPAGIQAGSAHVEALSATLASFAASVRKAESLAGELGDAGTADLFTEVSRGVDQRLWMVEAHLVEA
ncbi:MAG: ferritin-like domain-containing protein, partial [Myxococcota bacterium]